MRRGRFRASKARRRPYSPRPPHHTVSGSKARYEAPRGLPEAVRPGPRVAAPGRPPRRPACDRPLLTARPGPGITRARAVLRFRRGFFDFYFSLPPYREGEREIEIEKTLE
nr:MAG TPA: hypothetical protein [Caudoviricetes sp.]